MGGLVFQFIFRFVLAFVIATLAGLLWARLFPKISNKKFWQVLTFAMVLMVYSGNCRRVSDRRGD